MTTNGWIKLICTIGPASLNPQTLRKMEQLGVDLLRINMSHTSMRQIGGMIRLAARHTRIPLCIDTEGSQVRTGFMHKGKICLRKGDYVRLSPAAVLGTPRRFQLTPAAVFTSLTPGTLIYVDYNRVLLLVTMVRRDGVTARVLCEGTVGSNKAVNLDRHVSIPGITPKDHQAIVFARKKGINTFALSFARSGEAVRQMRRATGKHATIISKIETLDGLQDLDGIIAESDALLIDRGDLSREVPIEQIPTMQKMIISRAHKKPIPVYVATNLLESMVSAATPTRAEINDVANTLFDGANGLVLAAETAIGSYPIACVSMVRRLITRYQNDTKNKLRIDQSAALHTPIDTALATGAGRTGCPSLTIDRSTLHTLHNIASGCYAPLTGFMDRRQIESVLDTYHLPEGAVWPLPIVLQAQKKDIPAVGGRLALVFAGRTVGWIDVNDIYEFPRERVAARWFGTTDRAHPGVARLMREGTCLIGGKVSVAALNLCGYSEYFLYPSQVREIFAHYGWTQVVGFHTRNIPHRAHEFIQHQALERTGADGLFIHPALGEKKPGDFTTEAIMAGYEALIGSHLPPQKVLLAGFFADSWYSGPREAVFTALCRKNYGCTHFVVGRDHTGVGSFYPKNAVRALFERLGDIGIEPVFFDPVVYDPVRRDYRERSTGPRQGDRLISGTAVRSALIRNTLPPAWMLRPEVGRALLGLKRAGKPLIVR